MATLTTDELARVRREHMDHVLALGAFPYVDIAAVYDIIKANVQSSTTAPTTSSTAVTGSGAATITVASATGLTVGCLVVVDHDDQQETVTVKSLNGTTMGANFRNTHSGTYNVEIESALTLVRGVLWDLSRLQDELQTIRQTAGIKRADDVEFFSRKDGADPILSLREEQQRLRMDLARMCGLGRYLQRAQGAFGRFEAY